MYLVRFTFLPPFFVPSLDPRTPDVILHLVFSVVGVPDCALTVFWT